MCDTPGMSSRTERSLGLPERLSRGLSAVLRLAPAVEPTDRPDRQLARSRRAVAEVWAASDSPLCDPLPSRCAACERLPEVTMLEARQAWASFSAATSVLEAATFAVLLLSYDALCHIVAGFRTACENFAARSQLVCSASTSSCWPSRAEG